MEELDQIKQLQKEWDYATAGNIAPWPQPCPGCGRCPTCGRSRYPYEYYPPYPYYPQPYYPHTNPYPMATTSISYRGATS